MNDPYRDRVRESEEIDKTAWARLLNELLTAAGMTPEQAARPNGPIRANWRTIRRWLDQDQGVSAKSVRDVSRDLGYPPIDALVRVGFLTAEEAKLSRQPAVVSPPLRPVIRRAVGILNDAIIPQEIKDRLESAVQSALDQWAEWYKLRPPKEERPTSGRNHPVARR